MNTKHLELRSSPLTILNIKYKQTQDDLRHNMHAHIQSKIVKHIDFAEF